MSSQASLYLIALLVGAVCIAETESSSGSREEESFPVQRDSSFFGIQSKDAAEKRPFFVGSRYGRSPAAPGDGMNRVVQRNDRFFLGSRYGKRSEKIYEDGFPAIRIQTPEVTCLYTGVLNLYKCFGNTDHPEPEE